MKRKLRLPALIFLLLTAAILTALAAGGDSSDPLLSLSHLNSVFSGTVDAKVAAKLDASDQALLDTTAKKLSGEEASSYATASVWAETRMKTADTLSGPSGLNVMVLAGSVRADFSQGAVVDATTGTALASGTLLTPRHRYITAEDTAASFVAVSKTAVIDYMGEYALSSADTVDYNAMATALKTMHLFRGSFTGYGSGYDLELVPTRLQALIMFLRVLGEEDAALAFSGTTPFSDIAKGTDAARYVGYAYSKGYTNGYTATRWMPGQAVNVYQYTEFMLRALGYSSTANTNLAGTLERAAECGVLTTGETQALKSVQFLRADLVYISFRTLSATSAQSGLSLQDTLLSKGVFTAAEAESAKLLVSSKRIG